MFLTGPEALAQLFQDEWEESRSGRPDVPPLVVDPETDFGVFVRKNREDVANLNAVHDLIHCYHPSGGPLDVQDRGFKEANTVENVQVDIDLTDRTDPDTGERLVARERMVGDRDHVTFSGDYPYPGVAGEVIYILETVRRGLDEWDKVTHTLIGGTLKNSDATVRIHVELEQLAHETAQ